MDDGSIKTACQWWNVTTKIKWRNKIEMRTFKYRENIKVSETF